MKDILLLIVFICEFLYFLLPLIITTAISYRLSLRRARTSYDERQLQNRLNAYRIGFIAMLITGIIIFLAYSIWFFVNTLSDKKDPFPISISVLLLLIIAVGSCSFFIYTMFKESYVATWSTARKRYSLLTSCLVISLAAFFFSLRIIQSTTKEVFSFLSILRTECAVPLIFTLSFLTIFICFMLKQLKKPEDDLDEIADSSNGATDPVNFDRKEKKDLFGVYMDERHRG